MMDDSDLDVYEFRLYAHYKRVAGDDGKCWQSKATVNNRATGKQVAMARSQKGEFEMNRYKLEAMLEEFPFLREVSRMVEDGDYADLNIRVKRWTPDLFDQIPCHDGHRSNAGDSDDVDAFFAVLEDGNVIELRAAGYWTFGNQHTPDRHDGAGTVLEQVAEINLAYLVRKQWASCDWRESDETVNVTIYKPAKDVTVAGLIEKAREKASRELEAEIAF